MDNKPVLTIKTPQETIEVFMLHVGEGLDRFGGSSSGLTARKTPSLVTRTYTPMGTRDYEEYIDSPRFWAVIAQLFYLAQTDPEVTIEAHTGDFDPATQDIHEYMMQREQEG